MGQRSTVRGSKCVNRISMEGPFVSPEEFVKIAAETMKPALENAFNRHAIFAGLGLRRDKK